VRLTSIILVGWQAHDLFAVLAVIQEKVNNPSSDDPFEPDIAAVSILVMNVIVGPPDHLQLLKTDKVKFLATAKEYTKK
jgi:hypothetical protein